MAEEQRETAAAAPAAKAERAAGGAAEECGAGPRVSRRTLLRAAGGGLAATVAVAGLYEGVSALVNRPWRDGPTRPASYPAGQYQIADYGVRVRPDPESAVDVLVPPVWKVVVTARLARAPAPGDQQRLEAALQAVEAAYPYAPEGLFALVAYGLPYFREHVRPEVFAAHLPRTADAEAAPAVIDAVRFPNDLPLVALEQYDVAFVFRSDALGHAQDVRRALFERSGTLAGKRAPAADVSDLFHVTSVRTGFVGPGLPRKMAQQAGLPVAGQIPEQAPMFMGFTSTQQSGQAKEVAVSFDGTRDPLLPPLTTCRPGDYFAGGTALHLSHLIEDLDGWYRLSYEDRLMRMFDPGVASRPGRITVNTFWLTPNPSEGDVQGRGVLGHNEAVQRESRSPQGQALHLRADCNTLDPMDAPNPIPGVHFLSFTPTSQVFHRSRQAMDAPDLASRYHVAPGQNGINQFIRATRRQNFVVPPRRHRAFPLLELS